MQLLRPWNVQTRTKVLEQERAGAAEPPARKLARVNAGFSCHQR
jgi:hypothetical protein